MTRRFSTYMQILERENIDGLRKSMKNDFTYHLNEWGERQQGFQQSGAGAASAHVDSVEQQHKEMKDFMAKCKSQGGNTMDCYSQYRDSLDAQKPSTGATTETPSQTTTASPGNKTLDALKRQERQLTRRNANADPEILGGHKNPVQKTLNNISMLQGGENPDDGHVNTELEPDKSANVQQALPQQTPVPEPQVQKPQPVAEPEQTTLKDPPPPQPQQNDDPSLTDRFLGGVSKFGQAMDRAKNRIDTFHQRTGGNTGRGSLSKVLQYGLMGQEGITQDQVRKNVYDNMISQGYTPEQATQAADQAAKASTQQQAVSTSTPRVANSSQPQTTTSKSGAGPATPPTGGSGAGSVSGQRVNDIVAKLQQSGIRPSDPQFQSVINSETGGDQQLMVDVMKAMIQQQPQTTK